MKGPGILWMLQTAAGMSMAGPMFVVGIEFLRTGRPIGGVAFLALGAVALYFPTYLINRIGGPRTWLRRRLGREESAPSSDAEATSEADDTGRQATFLDRFRR
ncbi:hypothetical protein [Natronorubrum bangense]|uniref:Uncharacterized protein n=2 Tax=Natronorubrum bangense TaxID=61858 RepID=L9WHW8_9EURY|nr:hypothetical protein [Natronorubrum bangense]ELY49014.1 hypothetical protein C494_09234 [Natronorubrum bangense JCM 10635]QCC54098.1 hypothetical protein DV706_06085 [Natronorubrum bangense]